MERVLCPAAGQPGQAQSRGTASPSSSASGISSKGCVAPLKSHALHCTCELIFHERMSYASLLVVNMQLKTTLRHFLHSIVFHHMN